MFIKDYNRLAEPLTNLTRKRVVFNFIDDLKCLRAFIDLKRRFEKELVLKSYLSDRESTVEYDVSDIYNYDIYEKELLTIIKALDY
ncbi:hypothetical protein G7Y89_g7704 [Cudoniella acicularis]|uniref:Uncharacterized protein n=1 Tax=Cudoniella acicularis TaxID=354080 RepID=A0A8H4W1A6_9HELO|nr:hypothetical protein G7Y89_g7704 [Cudoniella acicularis]